MLTVSEIEAFTVQFVCIFMIIRQICQMASRNTILSALYVFTKIGKNAMGKGTYVK